MERVYVFRGRGDVHADNELKSEGAAALMPGLAKLVPLARLDMRGACDV